MKKLSCIKLVIFNKNIEKIINYSKIKCLPQDYNFDEIFELFNGVIKSNEYEHNRIT